ncbi:formimidoylglutamase [Sediminibacterium ginsengisoli]|uniref:Formiminoglutamase n=1 Tax=Sediminibacterium ginsengisoli TaxID=413434 RepID=A0A1T4PQ08_9BACT|nr:formimidoylglutamase [Sediminibacterium ginsengisoli]SJZ93391.1 formiminoglutamase [Sediminibacterium ginsengisoli]
MKHFKPYHKEDVLVFTRTRRFETKLGERIQVLKHTADLRKSLEESDAAFVLIGIPEDIGVKANLGVGGAGSAWFQFLQAFLNIQSNDFFEGSEVLLAGHFDFSALEEIIDQNAQNSDERIEGYRHAVNIIDDEVEQLVHMIAEQGKIPIVIGGGHNNAYPCIKGAAKGFYKKGIIPLAQINAINLDAHADLRPMEGRHSGNGFTYAEEDGYLEKYCVVGLHENYLPENVWMDMVNNPFIDCITYEDIFIREKYSFLQAVAHATGFTEDTLCGIELDLDAIEGVLSSAATPSGFTTAQARQYVSYAAAASKAAYLHVCEGATQLLDGRKDPSTGKLISYLVSDFVKAIQTRG